MAKYDLVGVDGNAFAIMAYVKRAMEREKMSAIEIRNYLEESKRGDYNHLILVSLKMIDKLNND